MSFELPFRKGSGHPGVCPRSRQSGSGFHGKNEGSMGGLLRDAGKNFWGTSTQIGGYRFGRVPLRLPRTCSSASPGQRWDDLPFWLFRVSASLEHNSRESVVSGISGSVRPSIPRVEAFLDEAGQRHAQVFLLEFLDLLQKEGEKVVVGTGTLLHGPLGYRRRPRFPVFRGIWHPGSPWNNHGPPP